MVRIYIEDLKRLMGIYEPMKLKHSKSICEGHPCCVHNPTNHSMIKLKKRWRMDKGLMERICEHGVGHPDPDDVKYQEDVLWRKGIGTHSCDGCCGYQNKK